MIFEPPRCFEPLSSRLAVFWAGWTTVGWVLLTGMAAVVGAHIVDQFARRMPAPRAIPAAMSASAAAAAWAHVPTSIVGTVVREAAPIAIVISSYLLAATYESPQLVQSNALPHSFTAPALAGGGFCYPPARCDAYVGVYKPPWWRNPTTVIGTTADVRVLSVYYGYLGLLAIIGPLMRLSAALDSSCRTPLRVRLPTLGRAHYVDTCCGEMLAVLFLWSLLLYTFYDALDMQTLARLDTPAALQRLGAACGSLLNLLVGLVLLPVGRALVVVGVPHERAVSYHRTIGTSIIAVGALHVAVEHARWLSMRTWLAFTFNYVHTHTGQDVWPWAVPMMNLLFVALLVASLAALPPIRRRYYNVFLALHVMVMPCFLLGASPAHASSCPCPRLIRSRLARSTPISSTGTLLHSWSAWKYALAGVALYLADKLSRAVCTLAEAISPTTHLVGLRELKGGVVALTLRSKLRPPTPGTTVRLRIGAISWVQAHPFTVSETGGYGAAAAMASADGVANGAAAINRVPCDACTRHVDEAATHTWTLHVKATGSHRWTDRLLMLARAHASQLASQHVSPHASWAAQPILDAVTRPPSTLASDIAPHSPPVQPLPPRLPRVCALWSEAEAQLQTHATRRHAAADVVVLLAGGVGITPLSALAHQLLLAGERSASGCKHASTHVLKRRRRDLEASLLPSATFSDTESLSRVGSSSIQTSAVAADASPPAIWLVWSVRSIELVAEFVPLLELLHAAPHAKLSIHLTDEVGGGVECLPPALQACVRHARADVDSILGKCAAANARVHVCTCCPVQMERAVGRLCDAHCRKGAIVRLTRMNFLL